jgi:hypothetical protein
MQTDVMDETMLERKLVNLPSRPLRRRETRLLAESIGFVFPHHVIGWETLTALPPGWQVKQFYTGCFFLLDLHGRRRASVDLGKQEMEIFCRFWTQTHRLLIGNRQHVQISVMDGDSSVFASRPYEHVDAGAPSYYAALQAASDEVDRWLQLHYPDAHDPAMYWH